VTTANHENVVAGTDKVTSVRSPNPRPSGIFSVHTIQISEDITYGEHPCDGAAVTGASESVAGGGRTWQ